VKIYLDNCALGRPEDTQTGLVKKQAEAVLDILEGVRQGRWQMVRSTLHVEEATLMQPSSHWRLARIMERLDLSVFPTWDSTASQSLYTEFRQVPRGKAPLLKPRDGLHLASAIKAGATVLVTVDRDFYLWARAHRALLRGLVVLRPGEFLARFRDAKIGQEEEDEEA
jgi:predicted nucleic acid-binding protein